MKDAKARNSIRNVPHLGEHSKAPTARTQSHSQCHRRTDAPKEHSRIPSPFGRGTIGTYLKSVSISDSL
jgi:hypothetical protein